MPDFPDQAENVNAVIGTERIFAVKADGITLIEVTPAEILAALKLKTINSESLIGDENIDIGGGVASGLIESWSDQVPTDTNIARRKMIDGVVYLFTSLVDGNVSVPTLRAEIAGLAAWTDTGAAYYPAQYNEDLHYAEGIYIWDYNTGPKGGFVAYKSKVAGNVYHKPADSPDQWERIGFYKVGYNVNTEYNSNDLLIDDASRKIYISNIDNNTYNFDEPVTPWGKTGVKTNQPPIYNNTVQYSGGYVRAMDNSVGGYVVFKFDLNGSAIGQNPITDTEGVYWKRVGEYKGFFTPGTVYRLNDVIIDPDDDLQMYISNTDDNSFALDALFPAEERTWQLIGSLPVDLTAINTAINGKADKIDGFLPVAQLPGIPESKLPEVNIFPQIKAGLALSIDPLYFKIGTNGLLQPASGTTPEIPKPEPPAVVLNIPGRLIAFNQDDYPDFIQYRIEGGAWYDIGNGTWINFGNNAVAANTYETRVRGIDGAHQYSEIVGNTAIAPAGGGSTPIVERTIRINFQSEYNSTPAAPGVTWNNLKVANSLLQEALGYTSAFLITESGVTTTAKLTNVTAFSGSSAGIMSPGVDGVYPVEIVNSGWEFNNNGAEYKLRITGLNPNKPHQIRLASLSINGVDDATKFKSGSASVNHNSYNNIGTAGENELASSFWAFLQNCMSDGNGVLDLSFTVQGPGYTQYATAAIIQETNIPL